MSEHRKILEGLEYNGLPGGAYYYATLPPAATESKGGVDPGVWSAAVDTYLVAKAHASDDPQAREQNDDAHDAIAVITATSHHFISEATKEGSRAVRERHTEAIKGLVEAKDLMEECDSLGDMECAGPNGRLTATQLYAVHAEDKRLAEERSHEGNTRHLQRKPATMWHTIAAVILGLVDFLFVWKPVLFLSFNSIDSSSIPRWLTGLGLGALQVYAIDVTIKNYVAQERINVDRRDAVSDYNRPLRSGIVAQGRLVPDIDDVNSADLSLRLSHLWLVLVATLVAMVAGARTAILFERGQFPTYEAAVFGVIIGITLGWLILQVAYYYCQGNILGDRLTLETKGLQEFGERVNLLRNHVAEKRLVSIQRIAERRETEEMIERFCRLAIADYWLALRLAWSWLGRSQKQLDSRNFHGISQPHLDYRIDDSTDPDYLKNPLEAVNDWLKDRPTPTSILTRRLQSEIESGESEREGSHRQQRIPLKRPDGKSVVVVGPQIIDIPPQLEAPKKILLVSLIVTSLLVVTFALLGETLHL